MFKYLQSMIDEFPEIIIGRAGTPAQYHLFEIRDDKESSKLSKEKALVLHHTVAQLLFMGIRARHNSQTAVAFLTTRLKNPDEDD